MNDIAEGYLNALNVDALSNEPADVALRQPDKERQQYMVSPQSMDRVGSETPGMTRTDPNELTTRSVMHPEHGTATGALIEQGQRAGDILKGAMGKTYEGAAHFWRVLDGAADAIARATGKDKGGVFQHFSEVSQHWADNYQGKVRFKDFATNVTTGMLGAGPGIAMFGLGPVWAGLEGMTEDGIAGAIKGVGRRWMAGKVFGALHDDPNIVSRMATGSAFFTAESAAMGETDPAKLGEASTIGAAFTAKGKQPDYFKPTPGQKVEASAFGEELDRAVQAGEMSPETAMVAKAFVAKNMGGEVDASTSLKVLADIKMASDEVLQSEGIRPGTPAIITGTAATITDGENLKTMIELYRGNDPTTIVEELFHRDYHRMSLAERQELRQEYDQQEAMRDMPRSMDEWYAQEKTREFFSTAGWQPRSPMGKMQAWLKRAVDKVKAIPGNKVESALGTLSEAYKPNKAALQRAMQAQKLDTPEKLAEAFQETHKLKYDGATDLSALGKPDLHQFTPYDGPLKGRSFTVSELTPEAIEFKMSTMPPNKPTMTPEFRQRFGDSKVVDENGEPLVVYHGTKKRFGDIDPSFSQDVGIHFGTKEQAESFIKDGGTLHEVYLDIKNPLELDFDPTMLPQDEVAYANGDYFYNNLKNIAYESGISDLYEEIRNGNKVVDEAVTAAEKADKEATRALKNDELRDLYQNQKIKKYHKSIEKLINHNGFDGVIYENQIEGDGKSYIVFDKNQITPATGNRGTFDPKDPSISHQVKTVGQGTGTTMETPKDLKPLEERSKYASLNINVTKLDGTDIGDVERMLNDLAAKHETDLMDAQGGPVSLDTMKEEGRAMAERLAQQTNTPVKQMLKKWDKDAKKMYARATAARMIHLQAARELMASAKKAKGIDATDRDLATYRIALGNFYEIHRAVTGITASSGRALSAFNVRVGSDALGSERLLTKQFDDLLNSPAGDRKLVRDMAEKLTDLEELDLPPDELVEMVDRIATGFAKANTRDMLLEAWINGLLSGPQTHAANTLSNALVMMTQVPERWLASQFGRLHSGEKVALGEARAMAYGMLAGINDGFRGAWLAYRKGESSDIMGKIEAPHRAITAANLGMNEDSWLGRGVDLLAEHVIRQPGKLLMTEDEFFKTVAYRMELQAQAYRVAMAEGLEGQAFADKVSEVLLNPPDEIKLASQNSARYMTFTNDLGETGNSIMRTANSHKGIKMIIPFIRTPTNVFKYAFARTPVAPLLMRSVRDDLRAGGSRRDLAMARIALGTMIMGVAGGMAASGTMTGGGPVKPEERRVWMQQYKPYSIKVGGKWVSYMRLEPVGSLLGMAADAWEVQQHADTVHDMNDALVVAAAILSRQVTSKTFTRGISDFIQAVNDPVRYGDRYFLRFAGTAVPAIVPQVTHDPYFREVDGVLQTLKARTPWASDLKPRLDIWGEPIAKEGSLGPDWISPLWVGSDKSSPIDKVMTENHIGMRNLSRTISIGGVSMKLDDDKWERYQKLCGNELKLPYNGGKPKGLKDQLNYQVQTKEFNMLSDGPDGGKAAFINNMVSKYRDAARSKLREEYRELDSIAKETSVLRRVQMLKQ